LCIIYIFIHIYNFSLSLSLYIPYLHTYQLVERGRQGSEEKGVGGGGSNNGHPLRGKIGGRIIPNKSLRSQVRKKNKKKLKALENNKNGV
jgi:hypothetical protein